VGGSREGGAHPDPLSKQQRLEEISPGWGQGKKITFQIEKVSSTTVVKRVLPHHRKEMQDPKGVSYGGSLRGTAGAERLHQPIRKTFAGKGNYILFEASPGTDKLSWRLQYKGAKLIVMETETVNEFPNYQLLPRGRCKGRRS